ncbi:unnamed protein product [Phytophthora fragariaefolia]|uniref:Unnamed protein product n=1 Tax=Phytophthora fragariaefolia TaxID=1490495 RepID=A0A9W6X9F3_9STRA|nr:unnamed protein product [Phytophthora fragariaefolia]
MRAPAPEPIIEPPKRFFRVTIVAYSVIVGLSDFSVVDGGLNPASHGKKYQDGSLVDAYSQQNYIVQASSSVFTLLFFIECMLKVVAMGFQGEGSYQQDAWNVFEGIATLSWYVELAEATTSLICVNMFLFVASLVASAPAVPNISGARAVRVLQVFRVHSVTPGTKHLLAYLLKILQALKHTVGLQVFVLVIFGIVGVQLFGGTMSYRCRMTALPIKISVNDADQIVWPVSDDYIHRATTNLPVFQCIDAPLVDYGDSANGYSKESSPWRSARDCFWPVNNDDDLVCAGLGHPGNHKCSKGMTCGSDYDALGNPRFKSRKAMGFALHLPSLNWGIATFDNIGRALLTIFQSSTHEGWSDIMYMVMDSSQPTIGAIFFVAIIFASSLLMNLGLAAVFQQTRRDQTGRESATLEREGGSRKETPHHFNGLVSHKLFSGFILGASLVNTLVLALDHYPMPPMMDGNLEIVSFLVLCVYAVEMVIKLFALGLRQYSREKSNIFDAIVVILGILETLGSPPALLSNNPPRKGAISVLRSIRLFRVCKLASLQELLRRLVTTASIKSFALLICLFIYVYALVGIQVILLEDHDVNVQVNDLKHHDKMKEQVQKLPVMYITKVLPVSSANQEIKASQCIPLTNGEEKNDHSIPELSDKTDTSSIPRETIGKSLFMFAEHSNIRRVAGYISDHRYYESTVLVLIVISCFGAILDNPLADPTSGVVDFLNGLNGLLTAFFVLDIAIKIVKMGLILHRGSYLRSGWNILEWVIVGSSLLLLVSGHGSSLTFARSLGVFKSFSPLRVVSRCPRLKLVADTMIQTSPDIIKALAVWMLFLLIFSIVAVSYLKGALNACSGDVFSTLSDTQMDFLVAPKTWDISSDLQRSWFDNTVCNTTFPDTAYSTVTSEYVCTCWGADWGPVLPQNFDNIAAAMLTLLEISTMEGWADVMMAAIDSNGIGMQPVRDNNISWAVFFVVFMTIGSFLYMYLCVGVIISSINRMKAALSGDFWLISQQKRWFNTKSGCRVGPMCATEPPRKGDRKCLPIFVKSKGFALFIAACIIVNAFAMAAEYFGESTIQLSIISLINNICAAFIIIEAVLKISVFGWKYFKDPWNRYDCFVVVGTLLSVVVEVFTGGTAPLFAMIVRVFRVARILRLAKVGAFNQKLPSSLYIAIPGFSAIATLLLLVAITYSILGVQLFAKVALSDNIDSHANFQNFGKSFLFVVRAVTGEGWNKCMHDLAALGAGCVEDPGYDNSMCGFRNFNGCIPLNGCGSSIAYIFFFSLVYCVSYALLNLSIAIILEVLPLTQSNIEPEFTHTFWTKWAEIDPEATGFAKVSKMLVLINRLNPPLGMYGKPYHMPSTQATAVRRRIRPFPRHIASNDGRGTLISMVQKHVRYQAYSSSVVIVHSWTSKLS